MMSLPRETIRLAYETACRLEIEALKPGNVHVYADGHDMSVEQFHLSANVSSFPLTDPALGVGSRILEAVRATREAVATNTNLGILLLCGPIAMAASRSGGTLEENLKALLGEISQDDTDAIFEAIVCASPGGLGEAKNDVRDAAKVHLLDAMQEASAWDMIATQYVTGFRDIFGTGITALRASIEAGESGMWPTIAAFLAFLADFPDSHIARKHGLETAQLIQGEAARISTELRELVDKDARISLLLEFDQRLKAKRINPGTSADLTVATLLVHSLMQELA